MAIVMHLMIIYYDLLFCLSVLFNCYAFYDNHMQLLKMTRPNKLQMRNNADNEH